MQSEVQAPARVRRGSEEVQRAILDSARTMFARKGYGVTSMREIAEDAGVYEPMIYRRFESKVGLFEAAVLEPLQQVIAGYLADWDSPDRHDAAPSSTEELVRSFMPPLYRLMREQRELILALMSAEEFHADEVGGRDGSFSAGIRRFVDRMREHVAFEADRRPLPDLDSARALLISFGLVLGLSMLEGAAHPERSDGRAQNLGGDALVEEMVKFTLYGVSARPAHTAPAPAEMPELAELFDRVADAERRAVRAEVELEHLKRQIARPAPDAESEPDATT
jgi:AcrR family transcriptional regulator